MTAVDNRRPFFFLAIPNFRYENQEIQEKFRKIVWIQNEYAIFLSISIYVASSVLPNLNVASKNKKVPHLRFRNSRNAFVPHIKFLKN